MTFDVKTAIKKKKKKEKKCRHRFLKHFNINEISLQID